MPLLSLSESRAKSRRIRWGQAGALPRGNPLERAFGFSCGLINANVWRTLQQRLESGYNALEQIADKVRLCLLDRVEAVQNLYVFFANQQLLRLSPFHLCEKWGLELCVDSCSCRPILSHDIQADFQIDHGMF